MRRTKIYSLGLSADAMPTTMICCAGRKHSLGNYRKSLASHFSLRGEGLKKDDSPTASKSLVQSGAKAIRYRTKKHEYQVSAGAFFQVNRHLIDELVSVVTGNARGDVALDLYAGVGLFSAALAQNFHHILGVEASQTAYADFVQNVPANVKAVGARTEDYFEDYSKSENPRSRPVRNRPRLGRHGPSSQRGRQSGDSFSGRTRSAPASDMFRVIPRRWPGTSPPCWPSAITSKKHTYSISSLRRFTSNR